MRENLIAVLAEAPHFGAKTMKASKNRQNCGLSTGGDRLEPDRISASVLDTSYLDGQVCGDAQLREELLRLYAESLEALAPALGGTPGRPRQEAAHKLKGASLAIGALRLALLCEHVEKEASAGSSEGPARPSQTDSAKLRREIVLAIKATRRRVAELLRSGSG